MSRRFLILSICYYLVAMARGNILVYRTLSNKFIQEFYDMPAQFGITIPANGLRVFAARASDPLACTSLKPPPLNPLHKYAVLVQRGNCSFEAKARVAQAANFSAVIVYNYVNDDDLEKMSAQNGSGINIPAIFVAYSTGVIILGSYSSEDSVLVINDDLPFNINTQLILPFSILIGLCFLIMIFYMICKCVREERRRRQHRLPKNMLKKIPITKFTKGQPYEMCVICLDEFAEGDKLRVLPCSHAYHSNCIDPWLTKNKRVCPICKRKVFAKGETRTSRRRQSSLDSMTDTDDDTTPLLRPSDNSTSNNHGTFVSNPEVGEAASAAVTDGDNQSSDDENVLLTNDSPSHRSSARINPFDRQPNLPPNLASALNNSGPTWHDRLLRLFRRRSQNSISITEPPLMAETRGGRRRGRRTRGTALGNAMTRSRSEPNTSVNVPETSIRPSISATADGASGGSQPSANNILNPNLSGSFKDDDELETHQTIYEPIASTAAPSIATSSSDLLGVVVLDNTRQQQDSNFIQTPSQGGIGVVALPNANLRDPYHKNPSKVPPNRRYFI